MNDFGGVQYAWTVWYTYTNIERMLRSYLSGIRFPPRECSGFKSLPLEEKTNKNRNNKKCWKSNAWQILSSTYSSLLKDLFFIYFHICICMSWVGHVPRETKKAVRSCRVKVIGSGLWATWRGCWEPISGSVQKVQKLLSPGLSPQALIYCVEDPQ